MALNDGARMLRAGLKRLIQWTGIKPSADETRGFRPIIARLRA